jgi:acetyl-CoA synthetase
MMQGKQGITLKILDYPKDLNDSEDWDKTARALIAAQQRSGKAAAIVSSLPETLPAEVRERLLEKGIAPMQGMEECLIAIRGAMRLHAKQQTGSLPLARASLQQGEARTFDEYSSKQLLKSFGIPVPESLACQADDAVAKAEQLGYPLVLKILSSTIVHKTDLGGVALNLKNADELKGALASMQQLGEDFLLERMAEKPLVELILGIARDQQFGLSLLIGAGGILVELFQDSQNLLFPVQGQDIVKALKQLKIAPLLEGYRGAETADWQALIAAVLNFSRFTETHYDKLLELDINPLFVYPEGKGVLALDAVIRMVKE